MNDQRQVQWGRLGNPRPESLVDARIQLHWAVQCVSAAADAMLEPRSDDSHSNLRWDLERRALVGQTLPGQLEVGLQLPELALMVLQRGDEVRRLSLHGHSLPAALAWTAEAIGTDKTLRVRSYRMPAHEVAAPGGRFSAPRGGELEELARWYDSAHRALHELAAGLPSPARIATWPHHFDMGGLHILDPDLPFEETPQIGYGMSPGDEHVTVPHYYVLPWPLPDGATLPDLPAGGRWHTDRYTGAVLEAGAIVGSADRHESVIQFLRAAVAASFELIAAATR